MVIEKMPFGKHRGKKFAKLPTDYLLWLRDSHSGLGAELRQTVEQELSRRPDVPDGDAPPPPKAKPREEEDEPKEADATPDYVPLSSQGQTLTSNVRMIYRNLAMKYHPDRGGTAEAMEALNELHDQVQDLIGKLFRG
jgi:hypothetical protein